MSSTVFKDEVVMTKGEFPVKGDQLSQIELVKSDLSTLTDKDLLGKKVVLNIFPSIDTGVCAMQLTKFSQKLNGRDDIIPLFASMDLPFALNRFCQDKGIENAITTSDFKSRSLENYGVLMTSGLLEGLYARAVIILDEEMNVVYSELVSDIGIEPDYDEALKHV